MPRWYGMHVEAWQVGGAWRRWRVSSLRWSRAAGWARVDLGGGGVAGRVGVRGQGKCEEGRSSGLAGAAVLSRLSVAGEAAGLWCGRLVLHA